MKQYQCFKKHKNLVLFFSGFAGDKSHFIPFLQGDFDFVIFYDYRDFDFFNMDFLNNYEKITLVAFSMGVFVANKIINTLKLQDKITKKIAINGTEYGIHNDFGIPLKLFLLTARNFDLERFKLALFGEVYKDFKNSQNSTSLLKDFYFLDESKLKDELNFFCKNTQEPQSFLCWDRVFISKNDYVFLAKNQVNFWQNKGNAKEICKIDLPHFPFFALSDFLCF